MNKDKIFELSKQLKDARYCKNWMNDFGQTSFPAILISSAMLSYFVGAPTAFVFGASMVLIKWYDQNINNPYAAISNNIYTSLLVAYVFDNSARGNLDMNKIEAQISADMLNLGIGMEKSGRKINFFKMIEGCNEKNS
jgi:hypothetical protein